MPEAEKDLIPPWWAAEQCDLFPEDEDDGPWPPAVNALYFDDDFRPTTPERATRVRVWGPEGPYWGVRTDADVAANVFCPTGEGGGVDPTCSPGGKGGNDWGRVASKAKGQVWNAFGVTADVKFTTDDSGKVYGEHGSTGAVVVNPDLGAGRPVGLNFKPAPGVTETHHLVAHEIVHQVYSTDSDLGREIADRLVKVNGPYGSAVSMYGAFSGKFENVIELGAAYAHSPDQLKQFSPEMYDLADEWASRVRKITGNVFCPTGSGGGVDPTCSPGERGSKVRPLGELLSKVEEDVNRPWGDDNDSPAARTTRSRMASALKKSGLSQEDAARFESAVRIATARMPDRAHELLAAGTKSVAFYANQSELNRGVFDDVWDRVSGDRPWWQRVASKISGLEKLEKTNARVEHLSKNLNTAGVFDPKTGRLHLAGDSAGTYAHELAHAIDHGHAAKAGTRLSALPGWADAFRKDIDRSPAPLSNYARTDPEEGFAEFARLVYASGWKPAVVRNTFPAASAFFQEHGLWPA